MNVANIVYRYMNAIRMSGTQIFMRLCRRKTFFWDVIQGIKNMLGNSLASITYKSTRLKHLFKCQTLVRLHCCSAITTREFSDIHIVISPENDFLTAKLW